MQALRYAAIRFILHAISASGLDRLAAPLTRGRGCILTFHRVSNAPPPRLPENAGLTITPQFLAAVIEELRRLGHDIIPLAEVPARLQGESPPFAVLTFDDGYRDLRDEALPVLRAHGAPFTAFLCTGFADRSAPLWWLDLEAVAQRTEVLQAHLPDGTFSMPARTEAEKMLALRALYWRLRTLDEAPFREALAAICTTYGVDPTQEVGALCMDWDELRAFAQEPLASIGAHSLTHPRLGFLPREEVAHEMRESRAVIARELGVVPQHFCYPVGDARSAGPREAELARDIGFDLAVTTQPGVLKPGANPHLLPRISVNGLYQRASHLRALVSGVPFLLA